jgi:hypothetical protein
VIYGKVRKKVSKTLENSLMQYGDVFSNTHFSLFTRSIGMSIYKLLP